MKSKVIKPLVLILAGFLFGSSINSLIDLYSTNSLDFSNALPDIF